MTDLQRAHAEMEHAKFLLRAGHPDIQGLAVALRDWANEIALIQAEEERNVFTYTSELGVTVFAVEEG